MSPDPNGRRHNLRFVHIYQKFTFFSFLPLDDKFMLIASQLARYPISNGPANEILVLITCEQKPPLNTLADVSSRATGLYLG